MDEQEWYSARAALAEFERETGNCETRFASDESINLFAGGVTFIDPEFDERMGNISPARWHSFIAALRRGEWLAEGYLVPAKKRRQIIPAYRWDYLCIDPDSDSAEGGGIEYATVQFARPIERERSPETWKTTIDTEYQNRLEEARQNTGMATTAADDEEWMRYKGITRERLRDLRSTHRTRDEKKGGRPKSKKPRQN